ncbi:MAG: IS4 family transposase [Sulfurimonas sp.]|nr:IS4 family transposase [Sulfurimonas sp.]
MNHNQKAIKIQKKASFNRVKNSTSEFIQEIITDKSLEHPKFHKHRERIYTPMQTLSMLVSQSLNQDSSCQNIVNKVALNRKEKTSVSTSAYCQARNRLDIATVLSLTKQIAIKDASKVDKSWKFRGRDVYLIDGTTLTMADTKKNQEIYPQPKWHKEGLGFPILRVVAIISLDTGSITDAQVGSLKGKGSGEQGLLRSMLGQFKKGDILLADAMFSTYSLLSYVIKHGIDIVFVQNGARSRKVDFTKGEILGEDDHIITIKRPKDTPEWMNEKEIDSRPKEIKIREIKVAGKILITTMMCPKKSNAKTIKELYKERWNIEVDFRNIKITLGLNALKCKTPEMVIKEMWSYFLGYNIIRSLMLKSAVYNKTVPRRMSFKHSLQLYLFYLENTQNINYNNLLKLIGEKVIGNRAGRIEPRAIKKRHNGFSLLMQPRDIARNEIKKNGHPKRMK